MMPKSVAGWNSIALVLLISVILVMVFPQDIPVISGVLMGGLVMVVELWLGMALYLHFGLKQHFRFILTLVCCIILVYMILFRRVVDQHRGFQSLITGLFLYFSMLFSIALEFGIYDFLNSPYVQQHPHLRYTEGELVSYCITYGLNGIFQYNPSNLAVALQYVLWNSFSLIGIAYYLSYVLSRTGVREQRSLRSQKRPVRYAGYESSSAERESDAASESE
ncbi:hypothetical protein [Alicyclobacillus acidoterrestris]|uniref:Uncharacterized protein n=1 Tax=Alicyclobacillus acidoterrestris (strain ATCC 49025 / DSM 3922 / CIP 106132 / NCIMB 13137 / GD3B) TaxID=1356854 RepID=T0C8D3_ALIAG|nr:hypothetical protein [Alicyclobacillus acidoterrestris]EPZ49199.1 hypothetical protein N007_21180 [Alicyclobacillus acidoterrestris ATCC 49025]UNO47884.1 hypothetical protein K1I37_14485 [Alicyclobacillus acidoterrestris]